MNDSSAIIQYVLAGLFVLIMVVASLYIYSTSNDPQGGFLNRENSRTVVSSARDLDQEDDFGSSSSSLSGAPRFRDEESLPSNEGTASGFVSNYSDRTTFDDRDQDRESSFSGWQTSTYSDPYGYSGSGSSSSRRDYTDWPAGANYTNRSASRNVRLQRGRWRDTEDVDTDRDDRPARRSERDMTPEERLADADIDQTTAEGRLEAACILNDGSRYQCRCLLREVRRGLTDREIDFISRPDDSYGPASRLREAGISFNSMPDLALRIVALDAQAQRRCRVGLPYGL